MNRQITQIAAAIALTLAGAAAMAVDNLPSSTFTNEPEPQPFVSTTTRAQVQAQLAAARQSGEFNDFDAVNHKQLPSASNSLSPILALVRHGADRVAASTANNSGVTREQVRAELAAARRSGELNPFDNGDAITYAKPNAGVFAAPAAVAGTTR
jgi:hypothetical protein